ncbi:hypothetical protein [Ascidiimonas sp. W6]|uniref:toxin-antitoxin system YwqK family antitoxin n=1 Tax=Ascidiimonas meishanensis TaxID=3128903 RepID=UPI0030EDD4A0
MKRFLTILYFINFMACAQNDAVTIPPSSELISMDDATVKYGTQYGQQYFANGSKEPYTGFLCARYDNGELESVQQFKDGVGNGIWINYDPDGRKESQGTYVNNKTEGPAMLFYEDGSVKAKGDYIHWKNAVGWWTFYDRKGNVVSRRFYTR